MTIVYGVSQERDWNALEDEAFRSIVRSEFETHYPPELRYPPRRLFWHENGTWFRRMAAKGWIAPNWPTEFGGMGLSPRKLLIFLEEQERWGVARFQDHGIVMVGPVLMRYGTQAQRERFLPPVLACDERWCQGFSEPNAGSDLASLRTEARIEGDEFIINGQKVWTTLAFDVTHIFVLTRTDAAAKKQEGISFLLVDLASPGIRVRRIRDIAGHEELSEVFFDSVRTPISNLVGPLHGGWTVAKSLLGFERIMLGSPKMPELGIRVLTAVARSRGIDKDPIFLDKLAALQLDVAHLGTIFHQFAAQVERGEPLGPDVSLLKIFSTELFQRIADSIIETAGSFGALAGPAKINADIIDILAPYFKARPASIYGGANEIQRNILAKEVLHLPMRQQQSQ
jgi:alkylation response protein AidB-like acyl-CoA dehydrogenase